MPLDQVIEPGYTPVIVDPFVGFPLSPPATAYSMASRVGIRNCGSPYFAMANEPIQVPGFARSAFTFFAYINVQVKFEQMPQQLASSSERHIVASFHESGNGGVELANLAVSPNGAVSAHIAGFGTITSQQGLIQPSRQYLLEAALSIPPAFFPQTPATMGVWVDSQLVSQLTSTSFTAFPPEAALPRRFMLFNGRDALSRYIATISYAQYSQTDQFVNVTQIAWDFTDGSSLVVPATIFSGSALPAGFDADASSWSNLAYVPPSGNWDLSPLWIDPQPYGMPRLYGPPPGSSPAECASRADQAFYIPREGAPSTFTPVPPPSSGFSPTGGPATPYTPAPPPTTEYGG